MAEKERLAQASYNPSSMRDSNNNNPAMRMRNDAEMGNDGQ